LIQQELDRRLAAARTSDPTRKREQSLQRELSQADKGIERLLTAYQEELLSLEQLRERMPMLRQRQRALRAELQAITDQANDRAAFLRLAETLTAFLTRLRSAAESLSVIERQKIVRLLVKKFWSARIRVLDQFVLNLFQKIFPSTFLNGFERDPVDSRSSVIILRHPVGFLERFPLADVNV
jgi:uncharacterized protein YhaN